jgi:hypothetical protein
MVTQVLYGVYKNGVNVGGVVYTTGENDNQIFSVTEKGKSNVHDIEYVEDGKIEHMLVKDGQVLGSSKKLERMKDKISTDEVTTEAITCMGVCGAICGTGLGSQLGECIRGCRLYGPAYFWCLALCSVIIGVGCVVGCDRICSLF